MCPTCGRLLRDSPGMEELLAIRERVLGPDMNMHVMCRCAEAREAEDAGRLGRAGFPYQGDEPVWTFDNFEPREGVVDALQEARAFAERDDGPPILFFSGRTGCGKTHLAVAIGRRLVERGVSVRYWYTPELVERLRLATVGKIEDDPMEECRQARVLILDDLGAQRQTDFAVEQLTLLVDERHRGAKTGRRLVVATNQTPKRMAEAGPGGDRLASRIFDKAMRGWFIEAGDYRAGR